ncbi:MAG TPA: alpha/beta hydrolase, partial [Ignavibacteriaceae bacterium]
KKQGFIEVLNSRTNQLMRMNVSLLEDIEANKLGSLSIENAVKKLNSPLLIIHGEQDLTVPIEEGEQLFNWSNKILTQFEKIPASGHTFDIVHPFESSNKKFDLVITKTEEFLGKVFKV